MPDHEHKSPPNLSQIARAFLYVGFIGFGGGLAILAHLQRLVVEKRKWLSDRDFIEGVSVIQALPGVIAANITCYIGFKLGRWKGAAAAVSAMILPAFLSMLLLSEFYLEYEEVPSMERIFRGMTPAIAAFILAAAYKMGRTVVRSFWDLPVIFFAIWALSIMKLGVVRTVLIAGGLGLLAAAWKEWAPSRQKCFTPGLGLLAAGLLAERLFSLDLGRLIYLFLRIGAFTFGGGYVMIPFLEAEVIHHYAWLTHREFVDSVALGQITPGPVIITATFVGYKVMGLVGACLATVAVFFPSFLITSTVCHYYQRFKSNVLLQAFLRGVAPAAVGMLASAAWTISQVSISNGFGALIALATLVVSLRFKVSPLLIIVVAASLGWLWG
jgi:chromate transporter